MKSNKFFLIAILFFCPFFFPGAGRAEWVEWIADAALSTSYNSNINNAPVSSGKLHDKIASPLASAGRIFQIDESTRLIATVDLGAEIHDKYDGLDQLTFGGDLAIRHKFGLGPYQPWIRGGFSIEKILSRGDIRDGHLFIGSLKAGKRLLDRVDMVLEYAYDRRDSHNAEPVINSFNPSGNIPGSVFDQEGHKGAAKVNFSLTDRLLLSLGYSHRRGDVSPTWTGRGARQAKDIITAYAEDYAFGDRLWAYKADTTTNSVGFDLNYAFYGGHASLNLGMEHNEGKAGNMVYTSDIFFVGLNYTY